MYVPRVLLIHPGTQYARYLAAQLQRHALLGEFHTSFGFSEEGSLGRVAAMLPAPWRGRLASRRVSGVPSNRLHCRAWHELVALVGLRRGDLPQEVFRRRNAAFQRAIPDAAIERSDCVIGFDTSSWIIARRVRDKGCPFLLDRSIGHPRSFACVAARLRKEFPDWTVQIPVKSEDDLMHEEQEHADAACIVVPSRFVAHTLEESGVQAKRIFINPFGVDLDMFRPAATPPSLKPLRFVFAGSLQPRKGLPLLLRAWNQLPSNHGAELWIVGGGEVPASARCDLHDNVRFLGRLSQAQLSQVFRRCHVFVLPTYFEGLAQVQIEAAACGLPVIGTDGSGCDEIVRSGDTGFILPTGDVETLRAALSRFISTPELVFDMRARLLAERSRWSWDAYGDRWARLLGEFFRNWRSNVLNV